MAAGCYRAVFAGCLCELTGPIGVSFECVFECGVMSSTGEFRHELSRDLPNPAKNVGGAIYGSSTDHQALSTGHPARQ